MIFLEPVQISIWQCLESYAFEDAIFLAERLFAEEKSDENLFIVATAYFRSGKVLHAYTLIQDNGGSSAACKYLMAKCAYALDKLREAEDAIMNDSSYFKLNIEDIIRFFGEYSSFVLQMLGNIFMRTERFTLAVDVFKKALKINPLLWTCFVQMCSCGETVDVNQIFDPKSISVVNVSISSSDTAAVEAAAPNAVPNNNPVSTPQSENHENSRTNVASSLCNSTPLPLSHHLHFQNNTSTKKSCYFTPDISPGIAPILTLAPSKFSRLAILNKNKSVSPISPTFSMKSSLLLKLTPSPMNESAATSNAKRSSSSSSSPAPPPSSGTSASLASTSQLTLARRIRSDDRMNNNNNNFKEPRKKTLRQLGSYPCNENHSSTCSATTANTTASANLYPNVRRSTRLFTNSNNNAIKENAKDIKETRFSTQKAQAPKKTRSKVVKSNLASATTATSGASNKNTNVALTKANKLGDGDDDGDDGDGDGNGNGNEHFDKKPDKMLDESVGNSVSPSKNDDSSLLQICKKNIDNLVQLLKVLGRAYNEYSKYNCADSIEILSQLSEKQYSSCWVQCLLALNYFEMNDYEQSAIYFDQVHRREPTRFAHMDKYSTVLWHLQREVALSALSEKLIAYDKKSPITWCVAGNCFSLHKEHDTAITFLRRAVQMDSKFTYGYTLLGHEYIVTEELEKALNCFRSAVRLDRRHYNAWFGIGTIYSKQERYNLAEVNFRKALEINSNSSVLMCHVAVSQQSQKKWDLALDTLNKALERTPNNSLCKFHRSSILISTGKFEEALKELEELKKLTPREPLVYYLTGKVHGKLGNTYLALMHYSWASDLDPKGAGSHTKIDVDSSISRNQMIDENSHQQSAASGVFNDQPSTSSLTNNAAAGSSGIAGSANFISNSTPNNSASNNTNSNASNTSNGTAGTAGSSSPNAATANSTLASDRAPFHGFSQILDDLDF